MLSVAPDSSWVQGDAVCLSCGAVAELVGVPLASSGRHEVCTSACREVLEKLCVRNDALSARVKELQEQLAAGTGSARRDEVARECREGREAFGYAKPREAGVHSTHLRVPHPHRTAACQTAEAEAAGAAAAAADFKLGARVLVRNLAGDDWRKGVFVRYASDDGRPSVRVTGLGELVWGHCVADDGKTPLKQATATSTPRAAAAAAEKAGRGSEEPAKEKKDGATGEARASTPKGGGGEGSKRPASKSPGTGSLSGADLVDAADLKDLVKTIADLKMKAELLQSENMRITTQLNKQVMEKATLDSKLEVAQSRQQALDLLTVAQGKKHAELKVVSSEATLLKEQNARLQQTLEESQTLVKATLRHEMGRDDAVVSLVQRLQTLLRSSGTAASTRKMASMLGPQEFHRWLLALEDQPPCFRDVSFPAGGGSRYARTRHR